MRTSLENLEKGQKALLALLSVQIDEARLTTLEAQRQRLAAQAQDLEKQTRQLTEEVRNVDSGTLAVALPTGNVAADGAFRAEIGNRQRESELRLDEVRRSLQGVDQEIGALRSRVREMEKLVLDAMK